MRRLHREREIRITGSFSYPVKPLLTLQTLNLCRNSSSFLCVSGTIPDCNSALSCTTELCTGADCTNFIDCTTWSCALNCSTCCECIECTCSRVTSIGPLTTLTWQPRTISTLISHFTALTSLFVATFHFPLRCADLARAAISRVINSQARSHRLSTSRDCRRFTSARINSPERSLICHSPSAKCTRHAPCMSHFARLCAC